MQLYLSNCRLIPQLSHQWNEGLADVVIEDHFIKEIRAAGKSEIPPNAIDCAGHTLMPGLLDIHNHLAMYDMRQSVDLQTDVMQAFLQASVCAKCFLDYGFTTIRDLGSSFMVSIGVRNAIRQKVIEGPRVITSGCIIAPHDMRKIQNRDYNYLADGVYEVQKAARDVVAHGADLVKIYNSSFPVGDAPCFPLYSQEELDMMVRSAAERETYVSAHAHEQRAIDMCLRAGVHTIEHASCISDDALEELTREKSYIVPTIAPYIPMIASLADKKSIIKDEAKLYDMLNHIRNAMRKAVKGGLKLGFGSDIEADTWEERPGLEFKARSELIGLAPIEILLQATVYNAEIIGMGDKLGQVRPGFEADLILLEGKPDQDISQMYVQKPILVILGGEIVRSRTI